MPSKRVAYNPRTGIDMIAGEVEVWDGVDWRRSSDYPLTQSGIAFDNWQTYVPVWTTSGVAPTLGNATISGRYAKLGKTIIGQAQLVYGTTTLPGTGIQILTLPPFAANAAVGGYIGSSRAGDVSAGLAYGGNVLNLSTTTFGTETFASPTGFWTDVVPFAWANTDHYTAHFAYEAA